MNHYQIQIVKIMYNRVFILFCQVLSFPPRIYKSDITIKSYLKNDSNFFVNTYNSMYQAEADLINFYKLYLTERESQQTLVKELEKQLDQTILKHLNQTQKIRSKQKIKYDQNSFNFDKLKSLALFNQFSPSKCSKTIPNQVYLYFDGASKSNPGPASIGYYATFNNEIFFQRSHMIGIKTNNEAQFTALSWGMLDCALNGIKRIKVLGDSKLVIDGMKKNINITSANLVGLKKICEQIQKQLESVQYEFIYRNENKYADGLANKAFKI